MAMRSLTWFIALFLLACFLSIEAEKELKSLKTQTHCDIGAIFNFGDSNSDTGCMSAAFYPAILPYGETFFHEAVGRASDGRLIIDFIAQHLGFPLLSAYIDSIGTSYRKGANFAAGSSTIRRQNRTYFDGGTPFTLEIQTQQFNNFRARTAKFFFKHGGGGGFTVNKKSYERQFPKPEDIAKAIYIFDIGQNDIADVINKVKVGMEQEDSHSMISNIVEYFNKQLQNLYSYGARNFWIHNTGPIGCLPVSLPMHNSNNHTPVAPGYLDQNGCVKSQNDLAKEFNRNLKDVVVKLREIFHDASFTYVDIFSAKYELISNANKQGFVEPSKICCGYHEDGYHVYCGNKATINGKEILTSSCKDPSKYISWDGVHYTEAANRWIADRIINGSFSDPPVSIAHSCLLNH